MVIAAAGSVTTGRLLTSLPGPGVTGADFQAGMSKAQTCIRQASSKVDIIHFHCVGFRDFLPLQGANILITLHAPIQFFPSHIFDIPGVRFISVSHHQARSLKVERISAVIENGIDLAHYRPRSGKRENLVFIGRICREKGADVALAVARALDLPLIVAGPLHPFCDHQRYFRDDVKPLLDERRRYIGPVGAKEKVSILASARCLLLPTDPRLWQETSSMVAMEAIACGVPVVAFRSGAVAEVVEHGVTGFVVDSLESMIQAVKWVVDLPPDDCRRRAEERFDGRRMAQQYFALYQNLLREPSH